MAKNKKENKDVILLLVEGATEVEFYKKMLIFLNQKYAPKNCVIRQPIDIKGIGNFKNGAVRQFNADVIRFKNSRQFSKDFNYVYHVFMCIDTDAFDKSNYTPRQFEQNPPIDKNEVKKAISDEKGVPHYIEACHAIEDWFLEERDGLAKFLKTKVTNLKTKLNGKNGAEKLNDLFKSYSKQYVKGVKCEGLVDNLDVMMIFNSHQTEFSELIELLN